MSADWDAAGYDAQPLPHQRWGQQLLADLALTGHERVLEVGAGTGRDTALLLERLPHGEVVAIDASATMLARLRERLGEHPRLTVLHADVAEPLPLEAPVDAVFSVATLHWVADHERVWANLAAVCRPGAQVAVELGGSGNIDAVRAALAEVAPRYGLAAEAGVWNFPGVDETRQRLQASGFAAETVELVADPARLEPGEPLHDYLATVVLGKHLAELSEHRRGDFVRDVAAALPAPEVDYVRLRVLARRR